MAGIWVVRPLLTANELEVTLAVAAVRPEAVARNVVVPGVRAALTKSRLIKRFTVRTCLSSVKNRHQ
ncbi:hypothetical protein [Nonomuraea sp. CA-141351]|uniref:hypothetical protein n=1 Tax=Nonomuraea sp. CA-141351 TaxID=3239996 RepID=UPI003D8A875D